MAHRVGTTRSVMLFFALPFTDKNNAGSVGVSRPLSVSSINFHANSKFRSTSGSTDFDEIYTVGSLYRQVRRRFLFINILSIYSMSINL